MEDKNPAREGQWTCRVALFSLNALELGCSSDEQSRSQKVVDCFEDDTEAIYETLQISRIDHMPIPSVARVSASDAEATEAADPNAPLLDLTPRAASTLRDVFETIDYVDESDRIAEVSESPLSSIADTEELPDISELPDNVTPRAPINAESDLPLLERQMFRTDI